MPGEFEWNTQSSYNSSGGISRVEREVEKLKLLQSRVGSVTTDGQQHSADSLHRNGQQKVPEGNRSYVSELQMNYYNNAAYNYRVDDFLNRKLPSSHSSEQSSLLTDNLHNQFIAVTDLEREEPHGEENPSPVMVKPKASHSSAFTSVATRNDNKVTPALSGSDFMKDNRPLMTSTFKGRRQGDGVEERANDWKAVTSSGKTQTDGKQKARDFTQMFPSPLVASIPASEAAIQTGQSLMEPKHFEDTHFQPVLTDTKMTSDLSVNTAADDSSVRVSKEVSSLMNKKFGVPIARLNLKEKPKLAKPKPRMPMVPIEFVSHTERRSKDRSDSSSSSSLFTPKKSKVVNQVAEARRQYSGRRVPSVQKTNNNKENEPAGPQNVQMLGNKPSGMTLQEALQLSRPDFIHKAETRREKIIRHHNVRREAQSYNAELLANLPSTMQSADTINRLMYRPV